MSAPEVWLRGSVEGVPAPLQPVAHALLQARDDLRMALDGFPAERLWTRPSGVASVGFHLQHVRGVVDRLFTYARGEALSPEQRRALELEERPPAELRATCVDVLGQPRGVGRQQLPSTVLGLLFHAAEHVQRHVGQLLVTVRVQSAARGDEL